MFANAEFNSRQVKLSLGLAVKNYSRSSKFSLNNLDRECNLFNRMFIGTSLDKRLNVLVVVCTNYHKDLAAQFNGKNYLVYSKTFSCIHEIILLDLSTPAQRVGFFGVHSESIDNIIGKNEAEFS